MPQTYTDAALALLKTRGYRLTLSRKQVLTVLEHATGALSAYDIKALLDAQQIKADTVSIYRALECLEQNHLVHRLVSSGKFLKCSLAPEDTCEKHQHDHCHHFMVCRACGLIKEVHCLGLDHLTQILAKQEGFTVETHALEFTGLCKTCNNTVS
jgi:Fur family transcriptional regulator, zinc uptake regulator